MPFKSQAERRFMYSQHPEIARRWRRDFGPQKNLPARINPKRTSTRAKSRSSSHR